MTYDNEAIVRHAYHTAEGSVQDVAGFVGSFAEDGVINMGHSGRRDHRQGEHRRREQHERPPVPPRVNANLGDSPDPAHLPNA